MGLAFASLGLVRILSASYLRACGTRAFSGPFASSTSHWITGSRSVIPIPAAHQHTLLVSGMSRGWSNIRRASEQGLAYLAGVAGRGHSRRQRVVCLVPLARACAGRTPVLVLASAPFAERYIHTHIDRCRYARPAGGCMAGLIDITTSDSRGPDPSLFTSHSTCITSHLVRTAVSPSSLASQ